MTRELQRVDGDGGEVLRVLDDGAVVAEVRRRGAQVTRWRPAGGVEVVFAGARQQEPGDRVAHGGIPVCFPWFAGGARGDRRPAHGPARLVPWQDEGAELVDGVLVSRWSLDAAGVVGAEGAELWPAGVRAEMVAELGPDDLRLAVTAVNEGSDAVTVEVALHSYLRVGDVGRVSLSGLEGARYLDKVGSAEQGVPVHAVQDGEVRFAGLVDRVYSSTATVLVHDPVLGRVLEVAKEGSGTTVVWNPGQELATGLSDLAEGEWRELVCVETAAAGEHSLELAPGGSSTVVQRVSVR